MHFMCLQVLSLSIREIIFLVINFKVIYVTQNFFDYVFRLDGTFFLSFNQKSGYKVFYKLICWLAGSLTCRLPRVMRSPPARRSRKFSHNCLMFGSSQMRFLYHTATHHSRQDSSGRVVSSSQRPLPDETQQSQQTDIHAPGGIRTHDLSRRGAVKLRRRPRGHWDWMELKCI